MTFRNITVQLTDHDDGRTTGDVLGGDALSVTDKTAIIHAAAQGLPPEIVEIVLTEIQPKPEMRE